MLTKVQRWGKGLALRIPEAIVLSAQLKEDTVVEISYVNNRLIITPTVALNWTLDELLSGINKNNIHHEVDTGSSVGNEAW